MDSYFCFLSVIQFNLIQIPNCQSLALLFVYSFVLFLGILILYIDHLLR